jgi:hypothetical protein
MIRWILGFLSALAICVAGVYVAWLLALCIHCAFASGRFGNLSVRSLANLFGN